MLPAILKALLMLSFLPQCASVPLQSAIKPLKMQRRTCFLTVSARQAAAGFAAAARMRAVDHSGPFCFNQSLAVWGVSAFARA
jgi:hypothetical protein